MFKAGALDSSAPAPLVANRAPAGAGDIATTRASGGSLMFNWLRTQSERSNTELQVYLTHPVRQDVLHHASYTTIDVDFHHETILSESNSLVWGLNFRHSALRTRGTSRAFFLPENRSLPLLSGFVQNEWTIVPDTLTFIAGTKLERNAFSGVEIQPGARILWTPESRHTLWGGVSRAVRAPSMLESDLRAHHDTRQDPSGLPVEIWTRGDPAFLPESVLAVEAGYRWQAGRRLSFDLAAFHSLYNRLRSIEPGAFIYEFNPVFAP
jgi:iron complex outermembrane recepter protein